jgi:hypothetical protein
MVDPGAPLVAFKTVSGGSVTDGAADSPAGGYTLLEADDLGMAVKLVESHPFVRRGGSPGERSRRIGLNGWPGRLTGAATRRR